MSDKKPGLFGRIRRVISSTVNDAVDSVSDPGQEIALMLDDLAAQIKQSEKDLKDAVVTRKVMEKKLEELAKDVKGWQQRAEQAVKLGDESLARAALERKRELDARHQDTEAALQDQRALVIQMQEQIGDAKQKHKSLNLRRGTLMAQARAAKEGGATGASVAAAGATSRLDEIESKIAHIEAINEVAAETRSSDAEAAAIDAQLAQLSGGSEVDDELARLKAKLAGKNALPAADDDEAGS